ncbi:TetR/AcrR family transcriptional regulator [Streptomyces longispororuber]|uniref:TetR/AcrR family transcriptional regulator n=1 Tax=Streptomyces longispororuber TaxID=68230 RepID=UPI00210DD38D|nr:TetR/AcrR family transcriptional regulator [Streptomyces longispororuber]MCQ4209141.1 TetR/AcrR family transcriptional regulator [Streptomyces longispororuber]
MTTPARRGRPRSGDADGRILRAAQDLLTERGYDKFAIDEVAARATVAKTTLYRRWPTKDHLLVALVARIQDEVEVADTGDIRRDLTVYLTAVATGLDRMRRVGRGAAGEADRSAGVVAELVAAAARHPDVGDAVRGLFARRNALPLRLLDHARERGALPPGASSEVLFDQLAGALYYRLLITGAPIGADYVDELVGQVLAGVATTPHPERT